MINNIIFMNSYGIYVLSSFLFTLMCFTSLFLITRSQLLKEQKKFNVKFGSLTSKQILEAKKQKINKDILEASSYLKI